MASYKISFKRSAEKDLRKIDKGQIPKIVSAIKSLSENPFPSSARKLVGSTQAHRLRIGDYRVVYVIFPDSFEIEVQRVRHRKDVYR